MFDTILVPTDGSENAERAIEHATMLADVYGSTVHGVFVVNLTYAADFEGGIDSESVLRAMEREGEEAVESLESAVAENGIDVTTDILRGRPASRITAYAEENDVDLVVMGTQGRSGVSRLLLGSVTESVLRHSGRPVLTVPAGAPIIDDVYADLLVATDGSDDATHAIDTAIDIGGRFGTAIHGLYVIDSAVTQNQMIDEALQREGERALEILEERVSAEGLDVTTTAKRGNPHEEIGAYAAEEDIDLIVLGSHGKGALERTFLGSVSERTIRTAKRPILVTRELPQDE